MFSVCPQGARWAQCARVSSTAQVGQEGTRPPACLFKCSRMSLPDKDFSCCSWNGWDGLLKLLSPLFSSPACPGQFQLRGQRCSCVRQDAVSAPEREGHCANTWGWAESAGSTAKTCRSYSQRLLWTLGMCKATGADTISKQKWVSALLLLEEAPVFLMSLFPYQVFVSFKTHI